MALVIVIGLLADDQSLTDLISNHWRLLSRYAYLLAVHDQTLTNVIQYQGSRSVHGDQSTSVGPLLLLCHRIKERDEGSSAALHDPICPDLVSVPLLVKPFVS